MAIAPAIEVQTENITSRIIRKKGLEEFFEGMFDFEASRKNALAKLKTPE
ncbi:MAG: hypothetical protein ABIJ20_03595 [Nanoarchaeota archaeon]|nr:hypothetical protein [Nanoarchaeota archaeon]MBU1444763.1 hypothetical protein [Nanoarchaeota archaeon]MBU2474892.1 hypothetical protein [Nanoarchaeota archaeon]